jgi:replicative DNA helicase
MDNLKCGITEIDKHLGGFSYGEMIISASRPGHGSFYLLTSIARGICYTSKDNPKCLIFTNAEKRSLNDKNSGDENIFSYHIFQSRDIKSFKTELEEQISAGKHRIIIIENTELDINKNKEFYRIIKRSAASNNILIFIKGSLNRKHERRYHYPPAIADIEGAPILEKLADKIIIMYRPEVLGIKDCNGRDQIGIADIKLCANDITKTDTRYIYFDENKKIFRDFTPEDKRYGYYYLD